MDRTPEFEELTSGRGEPSAKRYIPMNETTSLVTKIYKMKAHLAKYGHDYLDTYGYLPGACVMTDERRAKLDVDVEEFIDSCNQKIKTLQSEIRLSSCSQQVIEHREAVIRIVRRILNDLFNFFNHLKTTKIVRNMEKQKFDRLQSASGRMSPGHEYESSFDNEFSIEALSNSLKDDNKLSSMSTSTQQRDELSVSFDDCRQQSLLAAEHHTSIDPEEIQMLALENARIRDELITLDDEVRLIGKKVVQISKLQELFTEKVMEQTVDLNNLHETAIRSSENVREGNDLIRDAMMKNASTRVFILFYIITLGFTILFLDWYNP
jgi:syntaxin 18